MNKDQEILNILAENDIYLQKGSLAKLRKFVQDPSEANVVEIFKKLYLGGDISIKNYWDAQEGLGFIHATVSAYLHEKPDLQAYKANLSKGLKAFLKENFETNKDHGCQEEADNFILNFLQDVQDQSEMEVWFSSVKESKVILNSAATLDLWREFKSDKPALLQELIKATDDWIVDIGGRTGLSAHNIEAVLTKQIPIDGRFENEGLWKAWSDLWSVKLKNCASKLGPSEIKAKTGPTQKIALLLRMFPDLQDLLQSSDPNNKIKELQLVREQEYRQRSNHKKEAEKEKQRAQQAYLNSLVQRSDLEGLLPATKTETQRWVEDGRIPTVQKRHFQKWGKSLHTTLHDPSLLKEWQSELTTWREQDKTTKKQKRMESAHLRKIIKSAVEGVAVLVSIKDDKIIAMRKEINLQNAPAVGDLQFEVMISFRAPENIIIEALSDTDIEIHKTSFDALQNLLVERVSGVEKGFTEALFRELNHLKDLSLEPPQKTYIQNSIKNIEIPRLNPNNYNFRAKEFAEAVCQLVDRVKVIQKNMILARESGLLNYPDLFQQARQMNRVLHLHLGPTNSGKTHAAIQNLISSESGVYAAPLRLMAVEWADRLNASGVQASLLTGEERVEVEGARHVSSTIEMCSMRQKVDVAVVDEVQMISDPDRGWAWTQAILGLPAKEIHMTGSIDAEPWIRMLASTTNEHLIVHRYERKVPLTATEYPVLPNELQDGDAIVAFSRAAVLNLHSDLKDAGWDVAAIYGSLPAEVKREEGRRFQSGKAKILVATDAIGMGLNLPIKRVLFAENSKFDGVDRRALNGNEIRQIAGRAGRFGFENECGFVGAYGTSRTAQKHFHKVIADTIEKQPRQLEYVKAFVKPSAEVIELISELLKTDTLSEILKQAHACIGQSGNMFLSGITGTMMRLAQRLDLSGLALRDQFRYVCAPIDTRSELEMEMLESWVYEHKKGKNIPFGQLASLHRKSILTQNDLQYAENLVKVVNLCIWCALHWPEIYSEHDQAVKLKHKINRQILDALSKGGLYRICRECNNRLPKKHRHAICDTCFRSQYSYDTFDYFE